MAINAFSVFTALWLWYYAANLMAASPYLKLNYGNYLTTEEHWLSQKLDHFATRDQREFPQRYYEFLDYFDAPHGPIFLNICGESTCRGIVNDYKTVLAKKFKAAIVCLEHRYYGKSTPFMNLTAENLKYLSSKQAIFDLAFFRAFYQVSLSNKYNISGLENKWLILGTSYSGALSAWFRLKFPHLSCGSVASSGVIKAVYKFSAFDRQVAESAGPICSLALRNANMLVEESLSKNSIAVKALFGAEQLKVDGDFFYFLADAVALAFQYGNPDAVCLPLVKAYTGGQDLLRAFAKYIKSYFLGTFGAKVSTYNQEYLKHNITGGLGSGDRQWWYQVCTEVAYFQVAPVNNSIRSSHVNLRYHLDLCQNVFGKGTYPEVNMTNLYYGSTAIAGSKILFMNGSQDPWRHASKQTSSFSEPAHLIRCYNCGHGVDMRGCPQTPLQAGGNATKCAKPEEVQRGRQIMEYYIQSWLEECAINIHQAIM